MPSTSSRTALLKIIAAKANPLSECIKNLSVCDCNLIEDDTSEEEIEKRLGFWCQVVAKGDWAKFKKRLEWDGLNNETVRRLVSNYTNFQSVILPPWIDILERVIEETEKFASHKSLGEFSQVIDTKNPIPFEHFYLPCIQVARNLLKHVLEDKFEGYNNIFTSKVQALLERQLLVSLAHIFAPTLMQEFGKFRSSGNPLRDFLNITVQGASKTDRYQAFLESQLQDGYLSLFEKYSVLGRLAATSIDFWVESTAELFNRLLRDWSKIEEQFSPHKSLKKVVDIAAGLSDKHKRGRSVAILTFDTGLKLVYKPKNIGLEVAFGELLKWCNEQEINLDFKFPEVLNCSTHGWSQYIESLPCDTEEEVKKFYKRSGMLMCLIYILQGTDCHYENLIASGEYPVLVDMETLLHPQIRRVETLSVDTSTQLSQKLANSVLRTALLPQKALLIADDMLSIDYSGLGKVEEQTVSSPVWKHINTDGMTVKYDKINLTHEKNVPILKDVSVAPKQFIDDILTGFEGMYIWLMEHREVLLSTDSPLMSFANQECRLVFRNTRTYAAILANSCQPELMEFGMARSVELDVLSRGFLTSANKPHFYSILATEREAMEQLDIPLLTANTSSVDIQLSSDTVILNFCEKTAFEGVLSLVESLNKADLMFQKQVIYLSLASRFLEEPWQEKSDATVDEHLNNSVNTITTNILLEEAIKIGQILQMQAIAESSDKNMAWLGIGYTHNSQSFYIQETGVNLYDGGVGISLFLAALNKVTGDSQWRDISLLSLQTLRQGIQQLTVEIGEKWAKQLGIGGGDGLASLIYGLVRISQLLDEPSLLQDARTIMKLITPELITSDQIFDVVGGSAGTILGLLALLEVEDEQIPSPALELAIACGEHLLENQKGNKDEPRAWKTWRGTQLTGFSQGAAGISYALLRLYAVTKDRRWLEAAQEGIAYEQTMFSPDFQNWCDRRFDETKFQVSWAHGAPGIALARLGGLSVLDTDVIREEIAIALATTQKSMIWGFDSLCWGNFGRIETLLVAAQTLNSSDFLTVAHQATAMVLRNAGNRGGFALFDSASSIVTNPGFFHGLSGIGYEVLRIAYPHQLPSILLWQ